jgi:hypothetical protein
MGFAAHFILILTLASPISLADMMPGPPLSKDQIRRQNRIDDCKEKKAGESCLNMEGEPGHCKAFRWWWALDSKDRVIDNGKEAYVAYVTKCSNSEKPVPTKAGPKVTTVFECLICQ